MSQEIIEPTYHSNRSKTEIIYQMLVNTHQHPGISKSRIQANAYLSTNQLPSYLGLLVRHGLLKHTSTKHERKGYIVTEKGMEFIDLFVRIRQMIGDEG